MEENSIFGQKSGENGQKSLFSPPKLENTFFSLFHHQKAHKFLLILLTGHFQKSRKCQQYQHYYLYLPHFLDGECRNCLYSTIFYFISMSKKESAKWLKNHLSRQMKGALGTKYSAFLQKMNFRQKIFHLYRG